jgi:PAS domain S-box-containing protein
MFLLSPVALQYLPTALLQLVIVGHLLWRQRKSPATLYLILAQGSMLLAVLFLFMAYSIYSPISAFFYGWGATLGAMGGAVFMVQFAYRFPVATHERESRPVLVVSLVLWASLLLFLVAQTIWQPSMLVHNFDAHIFEHHVLQGVSARSFFHLTNALLMVWAIVVWARKSVTLSQQQTQTSTDAPSPCVWWRCLVHPQGRQAHIARSLIFIFLAGAIAMGFSAMDDRGLVPPGTFSTVYLLTWAAAILTYANSGTTFVSFVDKLVSIVLITILAIVGISQAFVFQWQALTYDIDRSQEVALLAPRLTGAPMTDLPEPIAYIAARPLSDGLFSNDYRFLFNRSEDLTTDDLTADDQQMAAALAQGRDVVVLREFPWLAQTGIAPTNWPTLTAFPPSTPMYRGALTAPDDQYVRYTLVKGDTLFEIGYRCADVRMAQHRLGLVLLALTLVSVLVVILALPRFLKYVLVHPLERLVAGIEQVNAGDLALNIPVTSSDEIGYLTQSFNQMAASLLSANQDLHTQILEQARTQRRLQQSEERFDRVVSSISDHIYMNEFDDVGRQTNRFVSSNVEALTGYPLQTLLEKVDFWLNHIVFPEDRAAAAAYSAHLAAGHEGEAEYRIVRANGIVIWVRDSATVQRRAHSISVYGVVSDITRRKKAEIERQQLLNTTREAFARLAKAEEAE